MTVPEGMDDWVMLKVIQGQLQQGDLKISGDFRGDGLHSAGIATFTEDVAIKGVAASALSLRGQNQSTILERKDNYATECVGERKTVVWKGIQHSVD